MLCATPPITAINQPAAAAEQYRESLRLKPDWPEPMWELAWMLANSSDQSIRAPRQAVELATRACELTNRTKIPALDALAAAQAASGDLDAAIRTAEDARGVALASGQTQLAQQMEQRIRRYRAARR